MHNYISVAMFFPVHFSLPLFTFISIYVLYHSVNIYWNWFQEQFCNLSWYIWIHRMRNKTLLKKLYKSIVIYTGCPRRNVADFGRVFLMLKYTDITQNTYIQSWTVREIMAREIWNFDRCYTLIDYQIHIKTGRNMLFL